MKLHKEHKENKEDAKNIEKQDIENKREKEGRTYQMWRFELCLYKRNFSNLEYNY